MKRTLSIFLLLAGVLLLAGCQKDWKDGKDAIRFKASSAPTTKTAYSGVYDNGVERINWVLGDKIRIFSDVAEHRYHPGQHWADYQVTELVGNSGAVSSANIDNVPGDGTGNGLVWDAAGDYWFYAIYPALASDEGHDGVLWAEIPELQKINLAARPPYTPGMENAIMTATQKMTTRVDGEGGDIELKFTPAFTAFEFTLNSDIDLELQKFSMYSASGSPAICGNYAVKYDGYEANYACGDAEGTKIVADFSQRVRLSPNNSLTFTIFALPDKLSGLSIALTVKSPDWDAAETRTLALKYKNGTDVSFDPCVKHRITGTVQGTWCFKYITLEGEALEWTDADMEFKSDELPQASQFAVHGVKNIYEMHNQADNYKPYRQTWVLYDETATVSFKIFSPRGGSYKVAPYVVKTDGNISEGIGGFEVDGALEGEMSSDVATKVQFTVKKGTADPGEKLFFKTTVSDGTTTYSLDSETQLYDLRGYHYFVVDESSITVAP